MFLLRLTKDNYVIYVDSNKLLDWGKYSVHEALEGGHSLMQAEGHVCELVEA